MRNEALSATKSEFDAYAVDYREIVNRSIRWSGEEYEYFIDRRVRMMKLRLDRHCSLSSPWQHSVLDFGCGTGVTENFLRNCFPDSSLFGVDLSDDSIQLARQTNSSGAAFTTGDGKSLPYQDKKFDLIYTNGTMHHIPAEERLGVLSELKRVLAPGGFLFLFENNPLNPLMTRAMLANPFDAGIQPISTKKLRYLSQSVGFSVVALWYAFFFPRFLKTLRTWEARMEWIPLGAQYCICLTR
ncbi:MAG: class I SAM-dependent methyltransferase [Deltaproteobacteria bacterium]|nr:class I SAM-dependent methyltransferase [Deltaproteobacteria bacterium]TLN02323.1 MAG: class I SAM-dependent methyltransferase [bacterium]